MNARNNRPLSASRGYHKIADAAKFFDLDFHDRIVLDIGSSSGGFTQFALDHGAKKVIAIEKGTNQMPAPLRFNATVELHEKTDIFVVSIEHPLTNDPQSSLARQSLFTRSTQDTHPASPGEPAPRKPSSSKPVPLSLTHAPKIIIPAPDLILADVSFLSLTQVLSYAKSYLARPHTHFLVMLKPQFEARPDQLKQGIVKNSQIRRTIIKNFESWLKSHNFVVIAKHDNSLPGKHGNLERFYYLALAQR